MKSYMYNLSLLQVLVVSIIIITPVRVFSQTAEQIAAQLADEGQEKFIYDSHNRRDPFKPIFLNDAAAVVQDGGESVPFFLKGIVWDPEGGAVAIINDEILKQGDEISGFKIKKIKRNEVILLKGEKEINLFLREGDEDGRKK